MTNKPIGLENLGIGDNKVSMSVNARILKENYGSGFCLNTTEQLRVVLKRHGIELHQDYIKESLLSLAHIKNDVDIEIENLMNDFSIISPSKFFKVQRDNNITFESKNKLDKMSTNVYGKYPEMMSNKSKYKGLDIDFESFQGITRVESKFNDWRTVKKCLGTRNFYEIINQTNVNSSIITKILKGQPMETPKVDLRQFKTISQLDDYARATVLFNQCNGNFELMKQELKKRLGVKTNPTYQINKLQRVLPLVQSPDGRKLESIIKLIEKLEEC